MRALLASLLFLTTAAPSSAAEPVLPELVLDAAFSIACAYTPSVDCSTIPRPAIAFSQLSTPDRLIDALAYPGAIVLDYHMARGLMDANKVGFQEFAVLLHEMIHVLDYAQGLIDNESALSVCAAEARAWWVHNDWLANRGVTWLVRWNWRTAYPHCQ